MLRRLWFSQTAMLTNYLKEQVEGHKKTIIVCPDPQTADKTRAMINGPGIEVHTIFTALKDLWKKQGLEDIENRPIVRKSDLLLELWVAWNKKGLEKNYSIFLDCFNLVTELRGYSIDYNLMEGLLGKVLENEEFSGVLFLLQYFETRKFHDENSFYSELAKVDLNGIEGFLYVFMEFKHFSGNQIDLIKNLSSKCEVFVPIYTSLQKNLKHYDWPNWLLDENNPDSSSHDIKIADQGHDDIETRKNFLIKCSEFSRPKFVQQALDQCKEKKTGIFFWDKEDLRKSYLSISLIDLNFKFPVDFFVEEEKLVMRKFESLEDRSLRNMLAELEQLYNTEISKESKNYRLLKVYQSGTKLLNAFKEYGIESLDEQDLKLVAEKLTLDLPRVSLLNLTDKKMMKSGHLDHSVYSENQVNFVLIPSSLNLDMEKDPFSGRMAEIMTELASIGPVRNSELDLYSKIGNINDLLRSSEVFLFLDEKILDQANFLDELDFKNKDDFFDFELINQGNASSGTIEEVQLPEAISPSRLQNYVDCPYKYYLNYLKKYREKNEIEHDLLSREVGSFAHDVVANLIEQTISKENFAEDVWDPLEVMNEKINWDHMFEKKSFRIQQNEIAVKQEIQQLVLNCLNIFQFFPSQAIEEILPEVSLETEVFKGKLDLLLHLGNNEYGIIDYKKSKNSIPSKKDTETNKSIQLSVYSQLIKQREFSFMGYFCLENPTDSIFFYNPDAISSQLVLESNFFKRLNCRWYKLTQADIDQIGDEVLTVREGMFSAKQFPASPKNKQQCEYCSYNNFCIREI